MTDGQFHLSADCPRCGNQLIDDGVSMTLETHPRSGLPVIPVDMFMVEDFDCKECRVVVSYAAIEPYVDARDD